MILENVKILDNEEKITCRLCGARMKRVYGKHMENHAKEDGIDIKTYRTMYPNAPIQTEADHKANSKSSGLHMKEQKYKDMFSEKIKGNNNPNHKLNTTEKERKERSPFSKEFVGYKNLEEVNKQSAASKLSKDVAKIRLSTAQTEYWIKKGFNLEDAKLKVSERQKTFTLDLCIEKYGEENGRQVYTDRQNRWQTSLLTNGNLKYGYSNASQELFLEIIKNYKNIKELSKVYFATKNNEHKIDKKEGGIWIFDFADISRGKFIEYNGDRYHANPLLYNENDFPHPFRKGFSAKFLWQKDANKIADAANIGFEVLTIWDSEYKKDKIGTLQKCLDFLNI